MKKFEYKCETRTSFGLSELNELGQEGWELIQVFPSKGTLTIYFKREIQ